MRDVDTAFLALEANCVNWVVLKRFTGRQIVLSEKVYVWDFLRVPACPGHSLTMLTRLQQIVWVLHDKVYRLDRIGFGECLLRCPV
jgi:hypothetical protein